MRSTYSLFAVASGELTGLRLSDEAAAITSAAPAGFAWIEGDFDPRLYIVQMVTDDHGTQIPTATRRTPPRPADSAYQTWTWSDSQGDWVAAETLAMTKERARAPILAQLSELDTKVARPAGEITQALALGQSAPTAAVQRLQAVNADKQALRDHLTAISASASPAALQSILSSPPALITS